MDNQSNVVRLPRTGRRDRSTTPDNPGHADRPNPQQWCGAGVVRRLLNVTDAALYRLVEDGYITQYRPERAHPLFWRPEIEAFAAAHAHG